jgi:streptogramin lyase
MRVKTGLRRLLLSSAVAVLAAAPLRAQVTIDEFPVPTGGSRPYTIVAGPDGALWFTESIGNKIGRITTAGSIKEYQVPTADSGPYGIATGSDGNIWFTERFGDQIARFKIAGQQISEFPIAPFAQAWDIAPGADGSLWFVEEDIHQVGKITTSGAVAEFPIGTCCFPTHIAPGVDGNVWYTIEISDQIGRVDPFGNTTLFPVSDEFEQVLLWDITPGPDGNLWFSELAGRAIGRITTAGAVTEHTIPGDFSGIAGVGAGWDGNIWYTENDTNLVGSIDINGTVLPKYDTGLRPLSITPGPDGNMWFTIADGNAIGRVNIATPGEGYVLSMDGGFSPKRRIVQIGQTVNWMFVGPRPHSVVDSSGLGLFNSGSKSIVSYFSHTFTAAGTYSYEDGEPGGTLTAEINIPPTAPSSATVNVPFPVTWATEPEPLTHVFDVQVQVPGAPDYVLWTTTPDLSANYTAPTPGKYRFRARLIKDSGESTGYSPPVLVVVEP